MNRPQKYERKDHLPQLPFHCEEVDGLPTATEALIVFLVVAFLTVLFFSLI